MATSHPQLPGWVGNKPHLLLLNRVDMVSEEDQAAWGAYFRAQQQPAFWTDSKLGTGVRQARHSPTYKLPALKVSLGNIDFVACDGKRGFVLAAHRRPAACCCLAPVLRQRHVRHVPCHAGLKGGGGGRWQHQRSPHATRHPAPGAQSCGGEAPAQMPSWSCQQQFPLDGSTREWACESSSIIPASAMRETCMWEDVSNL